MNDFSVTVTPGFCIILAISALFDSSGAFSLMICAVIMHECGHIIAMKAMKTRMDSVSFSAFGLEIRAELQNGYKTAFIMLAGPLMNLLSGYAAFLIYRQTGIGQIGTFAVVSLTLGAFHIMPLSRLDGANALKSIINTRKVDIFVKAFTFTFVILLIYAGLQAAFMQIFNPSIFMLAVFFIIEIISERNHLSTNNCID